MNQIKKKKIRSQMKNLEYKWKSLTDINSGRENNLYQNKDHTQKIQVQRRAHQKAQKKENKTI